jgi:hypothetical protein
MDSCDGKGRSIHIGLNVCEMYRIEDSALSGRWQLFHLFCLYLKQ